MLNRYQDFSKESHNARKIHLNKESKQNTTFQYIKISCPSYEPLHSLRVALPRDIGGDGTVTQNITIGT